jgi:quinol monooxygenase YgiN
MRTILSNLRMIVNSGQGSCSGPYDRRVLVVSRFRVPAADAGDFRVGIDAAHAALAARPGYVSGTVGRNVDDPELWVLSTRWEHVGAYRRALSSYDVKLHAVPTLSRALDEPSAYEVVEPGSDLNVDIPRA